MAESNEADLRQSLLKARIAKLPYLPAIAPHASTSQDVATTASELKEEDEDEGRDEVFNTFSIPNPISTLQTRRNRRAKSKAFEPLSASDCFEQALEVDLSDLKPDSIRHAAIDNATEAFQGSDQKNATFRVYFTPPRRRKVSTSSSMGESTLNFQKITSPVLENEDEAEDTVFVFFHGAGYGALSFALTANCVTRQSNGMAGVLAYDCRGHGRTVHPSKSQSQNLSLENMSNDGIAILSKIFPKGTKQPSLVLVGHSMGGAVAVSVAHKLAGQAATANDIDHPRVAGVVVVDVVEGTAIAALPGMKNIVSALPKGFESIENAIQWHVDSGTIVNAESARRSVPSLLKINEHYKAAESSGNDFQDDDLEMIEEIQSQSDSTGSNDQTTLTTATKPFRYVWRHDLMATEPFWSEWFTGLSDAFLRVKCARLLILAGADRLDKSLMIGQMQGKYQLIVFQDVGHSVQEDAPERMASSLIEFWQRNERINVKAVKGLRKVGE